MPSSRSCSPCSGAASWLFAAPATTRHLSDGIVSSRITPPSAQGARMSQSSAWILSGSAVSTPKSRTVLATAGGPAAPRGDVAPSGGLEKPPVRPKGGLGFDAFGIADDHGLPPAEVEPRGGGLVRHPPGQAEHVAKRVVLVLEGVEASPAERRPERGGMDGRDPSQLGGRVVKEHDLFELLTQAPEYPHLD